MRIIISPNTKSEKPNPCSEKSETMGIMMVPAMIKTNGKISLECNRSRNTVRPISMAKIVSELPKIDALTALVSDKPIE